LNLTIAIASAKWLVNKLVGKRWRAEWSGNSKRFEGECLKSERLIVFSKYHTRKATPEHFLETVLHEIAHAWVDHRSAKDVHGPEWAAKYKYLKGRMNLE
jgi:hypothetical protein